MRAPSVENVAREGSQLRSMTQRLLLRAAPKKMIGENDNEKATRLALSSMHAKNAYLRRVSLDALKVHPHHWSHVYGLLDSFGVLGGADESGEEKLWVLG